jgi:hypothetical protein
VDTQPAGPGHPAIERVSIHRSQVYRHTEPTG